MSFDISKQIIHLLYIALLVGCILNTGGIVFWHFNPNLPSIRVFEKDLKDVEFPLVFRICINKGGKVLIKKTELKEIVRLHCL